MSEGTNAALMIIIICCIFAVALGRLLFVLHLFGRPRRAKRPLNGPPIATLVVLGSGGHTAEMMKLLPGLPPDRFSPLHYVAADTDARTEPMLKARKILSDSVVLHRIARSREVGQGYYAALLATGKAFIGALPLLLQLKPELIVCNGPGTCFPVCVAAVLLRFLGLSDNQIIFVESICRVKSLSLTGKLLYYLRLADQVQVQWAQLAQQYPRSVFVGMLL